MWFQELVKDITGFNKAMRILYDFGLIEADMSSRELVTESRRYSMHSCVHMWTMYILNKVKVDDMA